MIEKERLTKKELQRYEDRFLKAKRGFKEMRERIAPYVKRRRFEEYSTAGEWCETSSLCLEDQVSD